MTREEAIRHIRDIIAENNSIAPNMTVFEQEKEALYMAIEALHREEAEEKGWCHRIRPSNVEVVVRCKECIHWKADNEVVELGFCCVFPQKWVAETFYCADGERRE